MKFRTLNEIGHSDKPIQILENDAGSHNRLHAGNTDIILVPQPSNDVNDPLRWPAWKKNVAFLQVLVFTAMMTGYVSGFSPALLRLSIEFKVSPSKITQLISYPMLLSGLGNFWWVPLSQVFGKRPVFVVASLGFFLSVVGSAIATKFLTLSVCRTLSAVFGSCTEAMGAAITNDIFYLHQRGSKMALYMNFLYGGNAVFGIISGFIIERVGWRPFCWLCAGISGANFLAIFFFVPETRFDRPNDLVPRVSGEWSDGESTEKNSATATTVETEFARTHSELTGVEKSFFENLSLWSGTGQDSLFSLLMRPWLMIAYPAVFWGTIAYGLALAWQVGIATISSFLLQVPPYNFSPGMNGLINVPALLGNLVGAYMGGNLTDIVVRWHAKRHSGIFSPEARLMVLVIPAILISVGCLMIGYAAQNQFHWSIIYVGYFFVNMCNITPTIAMSYVMDSYQEVAPEALVVMNALKNVIGFGFLFSFVPWTNSQGYGNFGLALAGSWFGWHLLALPLFFWGKTIRNYTTSKFRVVFW